MTLFEHAKSYVELGLSVIPVKGKVPMLKWKEFQSRYATEEELADWFNRDGVTGIGIVTGKISNIAVVDLDSAEAIANVREMGLNFDTPTVQSSKGLHLYYRYSEGLRNFQTRKDLPGVDLRGEGGYIVAPPSMHPSGKKYQWVEGKSHEDLPYAEGSWDILYAKKDEISDTREKLTFGDVINGVTVGGRNAALAMLAGTKINDGMTEEEVLQYCREWNVRNAEPLSDDELANTVHSVWLTNQSNHPEGLAQLTDQRLAAYFANNYRNDLRYWAECKKWLIYDRTRWSTDTPGGAYPYVVHMVRQLHDHARLIDDQDARIKRMRDCLKLESHTKHVTILSAAEHIPSFIVNSSQLDSDPMVLNVLNGTLDLSTGMLRAHKSEDFITRRVNINYDQNAACPVFMQFLDRIMDGNEDLIQYLQRFAGYCLTGNTSEQVLLFFYGTGANGKTTLANVFEDLLGDFASTAGSDLLMHRDNRSPTNDLAALRGARLVKVSEFDDGERLAEATIKTLTGGDRVTCRFLYGEYFEYTPAYKVLLLGNYKPKVRGRDNGIWRRIHLVPFKVTIPEEERDPKLTEKLRAELPGILAWAVRGCLEWQQKRLQAPSVVKEETEAYRNSEDTFRQWLDDCCVQGENYRSSASELLDDFIKYSKWKMTATTFGKLLGEHGFIKQTSNGVKWKGITLIGSISHEDGIVEYLSSNSVKSLY